MRDPSPVPHNLSRVPALLSVLFMLLAVIGFFVSLIIRILVPLPSAMGGVAVLAALAIIFGAWGQRRRTDARPQLASFGTGVGIMILIVSLCAAWIEWGAHIPNNPTPAIIGQNCGNVRIPLVGMRFYGQDQATGNCFWQAYQHCQSATLVLTQIGVDTGDARYLTVQRQHGRCALQDVLQSYSANFGGSQSAPITYACAGIKQQYGGLLAYDCGADDNLFIPGMRTTVLDPGLAPETPPEETIFCGSVAANSQGQVIGLDRGHLPTAPGNAIARCLFIAWQHCTSAYLIYDNMGQAQFISHTITTVTTGGSPCNLTDSVQSLGLVPPPSNIHIYGCASMAARGMQITIKGCGAAGDIILPITTLSDTPQFPLPQAGQICQAHDLYVHAYDHAYRDCFWQAYQHCQPATLLFTLPGDIGYLAHALTLQSVNGQCTLIDHVQFVDDQNIVSPFQSFPCQNLRQEDNELITTCVQEGDIAIA